MMQCSYVQPGSAIDYRNAGAAVIPGGSVLVMGTIAGIVNTDIQPGAVETVYTEGVFDMPCGSATFAVGDRVDWDAESGAVVASTDGGVKLGWVIAPTAGDGRARVKLTQG